MTEQLSMNLEVVKRDYHLNRHEKTARKELLIARNAARQYGIEGRGEWEILDEHKQGGIPYCCHADMVRELIDLPKLEEGVNSWLGAVWLETDVNGNRIWERSQRYYISKIEGSHAHRLPIWILTREYLHLTLIATK